MVDKKNLLAALREGEGLFQEFKQSPDKIDRPMTAFANTEGGVIYLGVDDNGNIGSFRLTNRLRAQIEDTAKNIDPPVSINCVDLGKIAAVIVKEGEDKPYKCSDGFFIRVGATNQKLSRDEILALAVRFNRLRFETLRNTTFDYPPDFSKERFDEFLRDSNLEAVCKTMGTGSFLASLGLCETQKGRVIFNHAGICFFAANVRKFIPQATINYTRYQGTAKTHVVDRMIYAGTLPQQLEQVLKKLTFDIPVGYRLADASTRLEQPHYPLRALEEAIINALVHRDYFEAGAEIMIDYYADRIEISNPGGLPGQLRIEELKNRSLRRNPVIAEMFYRLKKGERLGSGIARMQALMNEWKLLPPRFKSEGGFFSVAFTGPKRVIAEEKRVTLPGRPKLFVEMQNQIPEPFTARAYAEKLAVTQRTAQKDLEVLLKKGILRREGKGKNTRYRFAPA